MMVIGESTDGMETITLASRLKPDVIIMDIQMPRASGIEATKQIKEISPDTIILVLTIYDDNEHVLRILEAGATGYLTKSVIGREIPNAIRAVMNGDSILTEEIMKKLLNYALRYPTKAVTLDFGDKLSEREMEILNLAARGASNKTIAAELDLSLNTVKKYMMTIFSKLQAKSRTEAVINAHQAGLLSIENLS